MGRMRADLHNHVLIGFEDCWINGQGYGRDNLIEKLFYSCKERKIDVCAITSHKEEIPRSSKHDRFNWLKDEYAAKLPDWFKFHSFGRNVARVSMDDKVLYLVNGQTALAQEDGKEVHYLVVGSNEIPNGLGLEETMDYVKSADNVFGGAEHGLCTTHGEMGREKMLELLSYMTFVEGHNSQLIFPVPGFVPLFGNYRRGLNKAAQKFAEESNIPWIATSDAHRIEDAGISYIEFDEADFDTSSGQKIIESLDKVISSNKFTNHCAYENPFAWATWVATFKIGTLFGLDKKEEIKQ